MTMNPRRDESTGRIIADDAWASLDKFRSSGGVSFHHFPISEVREKYLASCSANGLHETEEPDVEDFDVDEFRVRVYDPRPRHVRQEETPAVLFIHGGGWLMGNLDTHHSTARRLALRSGFPVIAVDYRLAPEHLYPAAINDCRAALTWLSSSASSHGLDVSSISLVGDSAGGQLSAVLTNECHTDPAIAPLSCQILLYPITDISDERLQHGRSYQRVESGFPLVADTMRWFVDTYVPHDQDRTVADLSPLLHELPADLPPTLIITVDNDPLADEGAEYAAALAKAGCEVTYRHLTGYHHGLFTSAGVIARGETELNAVASYLIAHSP